MNDYLMLGATLGLPVIFCLLTYVWLIVMGAGRRMGSW